MEQSLSLKKVTKENIDKIFELKVSDTQDELVNHTYL